MKYYKFLNRYLTHNGFTYKPNSTNTDILPFNPTGSCMPGGLYFAREDCLYFIDDYVCEAEPIGEVYKELGPIEKWKAHSLKLGPLMRTRDVLEKLIAEGARPVTRALMWAACNNCVRLVELLLKAGVKPTSDVLFEALYDNRKEVVKLLLKAGAKPSSYALDQACCDGNIGVVKLLLEAGARPTRYTFALVNWKHNAEIMKLLGASNDSNQL